MGDSNHVLSFDEPLADAAEPYLESRFGELIRIIAAAVLKALLHSYEL